MMRRQDIRWQFLRLLLARVAHEEALAQGCFRYFAPVACTLLSVLQLLKQRRHLLPQP